MAGQRGGLRLGPGSGLPNGAEQRGARAAGELFSDGNRYPERTTPNKNTRFREKDAPHEPAQFRRGGYFYLRPVARRKEAAQLPRFSSI